MANVEEQRDEPSNNQTDQLSLNCNADVNVVNAQNSHFPVVPSPWVVFSERVPQSLQLGANADAYDLSRSTPSGTPLHLARWTRVSDKLHDSCFTSTWLM